MRPRTRKFIGTIVLLVFLTVYALLAMAVAITLEVNTTTSKWIELAYYAYWQAFCGSFPQRSSSSGCRAGMGMVPKQMPAINGIQAAAGKPRRRLIAPRSAKGAPVNSVRT